METASEAGCMSRRSRPPMTLDLAPPRTAADPASSAVLSSPDVRLLKLATPELEKLVLQQYRQRRHHRRRQENSSSTRHDGRPLTVDVTTVSEDDHRGFVDVLLQLHEQHQTDCRSVIPATALTSTPAASYSTITELGPPLQIDFSQDDADPTTLARCSGVTELGAPHQLDLSQAGAAGLSPDYNRPPARSTALRRGDAESASLLERRRARNRLAASRCRNRKLARIEQLQSRADRLRADNARLSAEVRQLRDIVGQLRRQVNVLQLDTIDSAMPSFDS